MKRRIILTMLCVLVFAAFNIAYAETGSVREINGKNYYFDCNGVQKTVTEAGLQDIDGKTYYFNEDSSIKTVTSNGYKKIDGIYYYMKKPYYIDETKARKVISNDLKYYFGSDGNLMTYAEATRTSLKQNGKQLELRAAAKQYVGGYDTLQGSCTDGTYAYYVLYNRNVEKCKIVKIRLSDNKVMKTSGVLKIHHGNGLTYNPDFYDIIVLHLDPFPGFIQDIS